MLHGFQSRQMWDLQPICSRILNMTLLLHVQPMHLQKSKHHLPVRATIKIPIIQSIMVSASVNIRPTIKHNCQSHSGYVHIGPLTSKSDAIADRSGQQTMEFEVLPSKQQVLHSPECVITSSFFLLVSFSLLVFILHTPREQSQQSVPTAMVIRLKAAKAPTVVSSI